MNSKIERNICFIPESAHGTNFASAKLVNLKIVKFNDDKLSLEEFRDFVINYKDNLIKFNDYLSKYIRYI